MPNSKPGSSHHARKYKCPPVTFETLRQTYQSVSPPRNPSALHSISVQTTTPLLYAPLFPGTSLNPAFPIVATTTTKTASSALMLKHAGKKLCTLLQRKITRTDKHEVQVVYRTNTPSFPCCADTLLSLLTPLHITREEPVVSSHQPIFPPAHTLHFGFTGGIMINNTPKPRRRSRNKLSQTYAFCHSRPHAFNDENQTLLRNKNKIMPN